MREAKKVYEQFDMLHRNKEKDLTKVTYSSLDKYHKSPYLQSFLHKLYRSRTTYVKKTKPIKNSFTTGQERTSKY